MPDTDTLGLRAFCDRGDRVDNLATIAGVFFLGSQELIIIRTIRGISLWNVCSCDDGSSQKDSNARFLALEACFRHF